jgi:hypothetical protein
MPKVKFGAQKRLALICGSMVLFTEVMEPSLTVCS